MMPAGRRRLELFGEDHNIRPGWVTVGSALTSSNFNAAVSFCLLACCACWEACKFSSFYGSILLGKQHVLAVLCLPSMGGLLLCWRQNGAGMVSHHHRRITQA